MFQNTSVKKLSGAVCAFDTSLFRELKDTAISEGIQKIVAGALIFNDGKVLLLKRSPDENYLSGLLELPRGGVDKGENIFSGVVREVQEETGLISKRIETYSGYFDYTTGTGKKARQFNFLITEVDGSLKLNPAEHSEYFWVDPKDKKLETLNISRETLNLIRKLKISG